MITLPDTIAPSWAGYHCASDLLPEPNYAVTVNTKDRGTFTASRHGSDWWISFQVHDSYDWLGLKIKDNDWWRYID